MAVNGTTPAIGTGTRNRLIEYTQAGIAAAFTVVTCYLIVMGRAIPAEFWTLNVGIVSFYFTKRSDLSNGTPDKQVTV